MARQTGATRKTDESLPVAPYGICPNPTCNAPYPQAPGLYLSGFQEDRFTHHTVQICRACGSATSSSWAEKRIL
jgi:hypothetical protein